MVTGGVVSALSLPVRSSPLAFWELQSKLDPVETQIPGWAVESLERQPDNTAVCLCVCVSECV